MEREILFRGKCQNGFDYSNGDGWVYGSLLTDGKECGIVKYEDMQFGCFPDDGISQQPDFAFIPCEKETVGQFAGLCDKNGVKIFEGDVLTTETDKPMIVGWYNKFASFVLNRDGWAFYHWFGESCNPENCVVIGNIHDNKELLK